MNVCIFKGRLTADPTLSQTQSNISVCRFTIAVDKYTKAGEEKKADFISCTAWRGTAEFVSKYFTKGQEIAVRGELHNANYEKDGVKHYAMDVTVDNVEFCGSKSDNAGKSTGSGGDGFDTSGFEEILGDGEVPF